jgi:hypothetical protein
MRQGEYSQITLEQLVTPRNRRALLEFDGHARIPPLRHSINFCHKLNLPVLGVIENMSGLVCPKYAQVWELLNRAAEKRWPKR